jgi:hypothetical protein
VLNVLNENKQIIPFGISDADSKSE